MREQISTRVDEVSKSFADNYTDTNGRILDAVVDNNRKAVDFFVRTADDANERLPEVPFDLPFELPTPSEAGERYMELVERLVDMNRDFSERVVQMNKDYTERVVKLIEGEVAAPAPAAKKTTTKKAATKKATASK